MSRLGQMMDELAAEGTESCYAWVIDTDHIAEPADDRAGTMGPSNAPKALLFQLNLDRSQGAKFRMYDDDGELYYEGRIVFSDPAFGLVTVDEHGVVVEGLPDEAFGPLWDFGGPNAGCTDIRYYGSNMRDSKRTWGVL